jgi:hypothetical protein
VIIPQKSHSVWYSFRGADHDYLFSEKVYIILSLTAKALLAWQIFFPVLFIK